MTPDVTSALSLLYPPKDVMLNGRRVPPAILFSPAVAEPILFWLASSVCAKLHQINLPRVEVVARREALSGCVAIHTPIGAANSKDGSIFLHPIGSAARLMLLASAAESLLSPTKRHPDYDYNNLLLSFNRVVTGLIPENGEVPVSDFQLNEVVFKTLIEPARSMTWPFSEKSKP